MAMLIACAPWEPPKIRTLGAAPLAPSPAPDSRAAAADELLTNRVACDKRPPSEERHGRFERHGRGAHHAREQPVGQARHRVLLEQHGRYAAHARRRAPPVPSCSRRRRCTMSGRRFDRIRHASTPPSGSSPSPRASAAGDVPFSPALRSRSSAKPSRGTTRASIPRAVPANVTTRVGHAAAAARAPRRCPDRGGRPVPPPAITTASGFMHLATGSAVVTTCDEDACCDTFSRMPMPIRLISSDDPPALTNGSGMPFGGSSPEHHADVEERLERHHRRQADREEGAEAIRGAHRGAQAAPADHAEARQHHRRADQPELFADDRVDEVVVRLGQVEQLLHAAHQPAAEHAAGADGDHRLDHLPAVAERIGPRIEERRDPPPAVVGGRHQQVARSAAPPAAGRPRSGS